MGDVARLPAHRLHGRRDCCERAVEENYCFICDGGLACCLVCHGVEAGLPTDCPGRPMTNQEREAVSDGERDYDGVHGWVERDAQSPSTWHLMRMRRRSRRVPFSKTRRGRARRGLRLRVIVSKRRTDQ